MDLPTVWFVAIAVLWTGYLVLEGFDFGVGMLLPWNAFISANSYFQYRFRDTPFVDNFESVSPHGHARAPDACPLSLRSLRSCSLLSPRPRSASGCPLRATPRLGALRTLTHQAFHGPWRSALLFLSWSDPLACRGGRDKMLVRPQHTVHRELHTVHRPCILRASFGLGNFTPCIVRASSVHRLA